MEWKPAFGVFEVDGEGDKWCGDIVIGCRKRSPSQLLNFLTGVDWLPKPSHLQEPSAYLFTSLARSTRGVSQTATDQVRFTPVQSQLSSENLRAHSSPSNTGDYCYTPEEAHGPRCIVCDHSDWESITVIYRSKTSARLTQGLASPVEGKLCKVCPSVCTALLQIGRM